MKSSKAHTHVKIHKIPRPRFDSNKKLTSFAGIVVFQALFTSLRLRYQLRRCFQHLKTQTIYGHAAVVLMLLVHLVLRFRRLRTVDYYRHDPLVARVVGLKSLPDVSTISRTLANCDQQSVDKYRALIRDLVIERLDSEQLARLHR